MIAKSRRCIGLFGALVLLVVAGCATPPSAAASGRAPGLAVEGPASTGTALGSPSPAPSGSASASSSAPSVKPSGSRSAPPTTRPKPPAPPLAAPALSGVGAADRDAWATWLGHPLGINETWNDAKDANGDVTWEKMDGLYSTWGGFGNGKWHGALSIGQPMFAASETVGSCATPAEITTWAKDLLKAWPRGDAYIRLGWEFNGNWYHWGVKVGQQAAFKRCWVRWYGLLKQVSPKFKLVWNPNSQTSGAKLDVRDFWPGKAYVDAAGPDEYALNWGGKLMSPNQLGPNGEPLGIGAWAKWVAAQGVPFAVPEWGIHDGVSWGSTDPAYIQQMHDTFAAAAKSRTGLAYETYFDGGTGYDCVFSLHDKACGYDKHKTDADLYHKLWATPFTKG